MTLAQIKDLLQIIVLLATIATMLFTLYKFTRRPHDTLEEKYEKLKTKVDEQWIIIQELKKSLDIAHEKLRVQEGMNITFKSVMLAFINFEIAYCHNTGYEDNSDLLEAKKVLTEYLTGRQY